MTSPISDARRLTVRTGESGSYPIYVGRGLLREIGALLSRHAPAHRIAVISDDTVAPLYAEGVVEAIRKAGVRASLFRFPAGERSKNRVEWARISDTMLEEGVGRDGAVVAVGGGVTGDLAGFVAATYMRGIPVVQCPTSLVAMVDASVGGKTGVDVPGGKNLVGAFHPPRAVVADVDTLTTLPRSERAQGLVEAIKHGAIRSTRHLRDIDERLDGLLEGDPAASAPIVEASVRIKAEVVEEDEFESGVRRILNFGHTLGHAIEAASELRVPHGTAVARGMILEARLGEAEGVTEPGTVDALREILGRLGLDLAGEPEENIDEWLTYAHADKKAESGQVRYVLLKRLGEVDPGQGWVHSVSDDRVRSLALS